MDKINFFPDNLDIQNKKIILRLDLNVPLKDKVISDDTRIILCLPFIKKLILKKAKIIIISHLGRPKGIRDPKLSLAPIYKYLKNIKQPSIDIAGGDGIVSFRREKYVPAGGPSGGNGGNGGKVIFQADSNLQTLLDFKFKQLISAEDGRRGGPNKCSGACGNDLVLKVPCGTEVKDMDTGIIFGDLTVDGETLVVAFGGIGGLGNAHYLSNRNRAPEKFT